MGALRKYAGGPADPAEYRKWYNRRNYQENPERRRKACQHDPAAWAVKMENPEFRAQKARQKRDWRKANKEAATAATQRYRAKHPAEYLLAGARQRARHEGYGCALTLADIEALLRPMKCALTGLSLSWGHSRNDLQPSLDRIDNAKGYLPENTRVVAWRINMMRGNLPDEDFLHYARLLVQENVK